MGWATAQAQVTVVPTKPQVGSSNPATPVPAVTNAKPPQGCTVSLLNDAQYTSYASVPLNYTPPTSSCPGPWSKVVLTADFTVTAGNQYDRTAYFFLGGANIFYGTTAEPTATLSPSWHVERDVTDLTALLEKPQTGSAFAGNIVEPGLNGVINVNAALEFFPATADSPAPRVPDVIVPVNNGNNSPVTLNTGTDQATATLNLPRNVERVYLDVISQGQIGDEFWYTCFPNDIATTLDNCGSTAFRETEITIDGKPAGVAPVYPWIFTGGIDPNLWQPIVGIQTLDFKPYRVDLTPFASLLDDGQTHTLAISVYNADGYFLETANLLAYTDHGQAVLEGGLLKNTLAAEPTPQVNENLSTSSTSETTGSIDTSSDRKFEISGYLQTSHGRVETTVQDSVHFENLQTLDMGSTISLQNITQKSTDDQTVTTVSGLQTETATRYTSFPLTLEFVYQNQNPKVSPMIENVSVTQGYIVKHAHTLQGVPVSSSSVEEKVSSTDDQAVSPAGVYSDSSHASASYQQTNAKGGCFSREIKAKNNVLTSVKDGAGCAAQ